MPNVIKWNESPTYYNNEGITFLNYTLGCCKFDYGPSDATDYWNCIEPGTYILEFDIIANYLLYWYPIDDIMFWRIYPFNTIEEVLIFINNKFNQSLLSTYELIDFIRTESNGRLFLSNRDYDWRMITENLILYIDSYHINSYPTENVIWFNLVGPSTTVNNGNINNQFTWTDSTIMFSNEKDVLTYVEFASLSDKMTQATSYNGVSVEVWLNISEDIYTETTIIDTDNYRVFFNSDKVLCITIKDDNTYSSDLNISNFTTGYHQICFTCLYNKSIDLYFDGEPSYQWGFSSTVNPPINYCFLGIDSDSMSYGIVGGIPLLRIYNRKITASEVSSNYIATMVRYG